MDPDPDRGEDPPLTPEKKSRNACMFRLVVLVLASGARVLGVVGFSARKNARVGRERGRNTMCQRSLPWERGRRVMC